MGGLRPCSLLEDYFLLNSDFEFVVELMQQRFVLLFLNELGFALHQIVIHRTGSLDSTAWYSWQRALMRQDWKTLVFAAHI